MSRAAKFYNLISSFESVVNSILYSMRVSLTFYRPHAVKIWGILFPREQSNIIKHDSVQEKLTV